MCVADDDDDDNDEVVAKRVNVARVTLDEIDSIAAENRIVWRKWKTTQRQFPSA